MLFSLGKDMDQNVSMHNLIASLSMHGWGGRQFGLPYNCCKLIGELWRVFMVIMKSLLRIVVVIPPELYFDLYLSLVPRKPDVCQV